MNKASVKELWVARVKVEGRWVTIGEFPSCMEASLARAAAGTLWNRIKDHVDLLPTWEEQK